MIYLTGVSRDPYEVSIDIDAMMLQTVFHWDTETNTPKRKGGLSWSVQWGNLVGGICGVLGAGTVTGFNGYSPQFTVQQTLAAWMGDSGAGQYNLETWVGGGVTDIGGTALAQDYGASAYDCGGTAYFRVPADLCCELDTTDFIDNCGGYEPTYGGGSVPYDTVPYTNRSYFWRARPGGTLSVSVIASGGTVTTSGTIGPGGTVLPENCTLSAWAKMDIDTTGAGTQDSGIHVQADTIPLVGDDHVETRGGGGYVSAEDGILAHAVYAVGSTGVTGTLNGYKVRIATVPIGVNAMDQVYPGTVTLRAATIGTAGTAVFSDVSVPNGRGSVSITERKFTTGWQFAVGDSGNRIVNEWAPFYAFVKPASLSAFGEDAHEWRCMIRGRSYDAWGGVSQSGTFEIGSAFSGAGSAVQSFGGTASQTYRYLHVATDLVSAPLRVTLTGQQWDGCAEADPVAWSGQWSGNTDGSGVFVCDLCSPQDKNAPTDGHDTRWIDLDETAAPEAPYWGPDYLSSITLDEFAGSVNVSSTSLRRHSHSILQTAGPLEYGPEGGTATWLHILHSEAGAVTTDSYIRPWLVSDCDGRRGVDTWVLEKIVTQSSGDTTVAYVVRTVESLLETDLADGRNPGWGGSLSPGTDIADGTAYSLFDPGYLNKNRPAGWLGGGGLMRIGGAWDTSGVSGFSCNQDATIQAQELIDTVVDWPGNCGDVLGVADSAQTGPIILPVGKVLRGGAWGIVTDTNGDPLGGERIDLIDNAQNEKGNGASGDALGEYATSSPFGVTAFHHIERHTEPSAAVSANPLRPRRWRRACFRVTPAGTRQPISLDVTKWNRHVRAYASGGTVYTGRASNANPQAWEDTELSLTGTACCLRVRHPTMSQAWALAYHNAGSAYLIESTDEGATWGMPTTLFAGSIPALAVSPDGRMFAYGFDGSAIIGSCLDGAGSVVADLGTVIGTATPTGLGASVWPSAGRAMKVGLLYTSDAGNLTMATSLDGRTFS